MATIEFDLPHGIGDQTTCVLKEPTAGDIFAANEASEKVVLVPVDIDEKGNTVTEPQLVISPTLVSLHRLRLQIVSLGELQGPLEVEQMNRLSPDDLELLQKKSAKLDSAANNTVIKASGAVAQQGRDDTAE